MSCLFLSRTFHEREKIQEVSLNEKKDKSILTCLSFTLNVFQTFRPGSDAVLHMSRIEFNELSSCEVRRLNQFETADIIRIGSAVLHVWLRQE